MTLNKEILGVDLLVLVTIITGAFLCSSSITATSTSTTASVTVAEACTMSSTVTSPHTAIIPSNTYREDIGITTIKVVCNDPQGYAIYAVGYTGDEIGGTNSTKLVGTSTSNNVIDTGTATSGTTSNWAMKVSTSGSNYVGIIDNNYDNYQNVPAAYTKVAHKDSATDFGTNATGSTYQTTYAAFVSRTQGAGNYAGKVKYTMVHPANEFVPHEVACQAGSICYNPNTAIVEGQMGNQSATNNSNRVLYAPNFKRTGYGFAGWNTAYDYSGTNYGPNQTITAPADVQTNGLSLYAVWIKSAGSLQNWNGCSSLASGATTALTDERDNNTYAVAKLADNKCWMIENLRLADKDSSNNDINLSSTNTHNPSLPLNNSWYYKNQQSTLTTSNHLSTTSDPTSTDPDTAWCDTYNSSDCVDQSMLATNNTTLFTSNTASGYSAESNVYSYGNYYNWYSATGGHGKYGSSYGPGYNAPGDICPAGWHLPKGGNKTYESTNEFWQLIVTGINNGVNPANYDSNTQPFYTGTPEGSDVSNALRSYPNNFVYSGNVDGSSVYDRNSGGHYWSASGYNSNSAYNMIFYSTYVRPGTYNRYKYYGRMVRCVAGV